MGTWGTGILENDDALDYYTIFFDAYNLGEKPAQIRKAIEQAHFSGEPAVIDNTHYWLALALAQWECKALEEDVRAVVEQIVAEELEQEDWEESFPERKKELEKFYQQIGTPVAKAKRRVKPKSEPPFQPGDCLTLRLEEQYYVGLVVVATSKPTDKIGWSMVFMLDFRRESVPDLAAFQQSNIIFSWRDTPFGIGGTTIDRPIELFQIVILFKEDLERLRTHYQKVGSLSLRPFQAGIDTWSSYKEIPYFEAEGLRGISDVGLLLDRDLTRAFSSPEYLLPHTKPLREILAEQ